jgi:hypothetical protein
MKKIVVVGGGPAGMMAAIAAAENQAQVTLLEKKEKLGKKLRITGKGRCNITSALAGDIFLTRYTGNGRFLFSVFNEFSNRDLISYFEKHNLKCKVERGSRVFPETDNAADVVKVLYNNLINLGVHIKTSCKVNRLLYQEQTVLGVKAGKSRIDSDAVIIATGGMSYPATGSTGDGYKWAQEAGHNIIEPRPGLVPLVTHEDWIKELQGLSLKNIKAFAYELNGEKINEDFGEMIFTHYGVSGPIILSMSRDIGEKIRQKRQPVNLLVDLKPALDEEKLDRRVCRDLKKYANKQFKNSLVDLLPKKLIPVIIRLSEIDESIECNQLTKVDRKKLVHLIKHFSLTITGTRPIAEAIVTAGGISVKEVNPKTMESKLFKRLYFAGEVLDVDGYTGGYNLQAAFSTGYAAGKYAALADNKRPL